MKTLRDLIPGDPHPDEAVSTIQAALQQVEIVPEVDPLAGFFTRMPGDSLEGHIKAAEIIANPVPGASPMDLSRGLREGAYAIDLERKVRAFIAQYQRFTGEVLYDSRNHVPTCSTEQGYADFDTVSSASSGSLRRADPFGT